MYMILDAANPNSKSMSIIGQRPVPSIAISQSSHEKNKSNISNKSGPFGQTPDIIHNSYHFPVRIRHRNTNIDPTSYFGIVGL